MATRKIKRFGSEFEVPDIFNKDTTPSEVAAYIYNFINEQKKPSMIHTKGFHGGVSCKYRQDGCCCAVGCLIDDSEFVEGYTVDYLIEKLTDVDETKSISYKIQDVLSKAQDCHDGAASSNPENFLTDFNKRMSERGLIHLTTTSEVNNEQV